VDFTYSFVPLRFDTKWSIGKSLQRVSE
jgi:hypothetical protein